MQSPDQRKLTIIFSAGLALAVAALMTILDCFVFSQFNAVRSLLILLMVFVGSMVVIRIIINDFIYSKVKLIYKTIYNLKTPKKELQEMLSAESDALDKVNKQVVSWAENKQKEIQVLKEQETYRREFIGNVSHELKTPIFNIQGYVHTLLDGGLEDKDINRKFLRRADKSVERMISVVEDLGTISSLESGRVELNIEPINIVELASEVIEMEEMKAEKRHMTIGFSTEHDRPVNVLADGDQIRQVYLNLIDNAIKYGTPNGHVTLRFYDMDQHVLCEVADDGPGIEARHIPRLYERFYRVDKARSRNAGGTGLGLSIVKHIIEAHGETINVRSQTGKNAGTTFSFTLRKA